jgi:hypothetical protein
MPISTQDHNSLTLKSQIPNKLQIQHTKQSPQSETQQSLKLTRSIRSQTRNRNQDSTQNPPIRHAFKSSTQEKTPRNPKIHAPTASIWTANHRNSHPNPKQAQVKNRNQTRRNEKKLTPQGRRAGARLQQGRPWPRLPGEPPDHPCPLLCTAPDPPSCTRSVSGTLPTAFFFKSKTLILSYMHFHEA